MNEKKSLSEGTKNIVLCLLVFLVIILMVAIVWLVNTVSKKMDDQNKVIAQLQNQQVKTQIENQVQTEVKKEENTIKQKETELTQTELAKIEQKLNDRLYMLFLVNEFSRPEEENTYSILSFDGADIAPTGFTHRINMSEKEYIDVLAYLYEEDFPNILQNDTLNKEQKHLRIVEKIKETENDELSKYFEGSPIFEIKAPYNVAKEYLLANLAITEAQAVNMLEAFKQVIIANYIEETNCFYIGSQGPIISAEHIIKCIKGNKNNDGLYTVEYTANFHHNGENQSYVTSFYINGDTYKFVSNLKK